MTRVWPLSAGGAAEAEAALLVPAPGLTVTDRTAWPRFGIKGPGAADWLAAAGLALPAPNRIGAAPGMAILRLGGNDVTILGDPADPAPLATLRARWEAAGGPKGWSSWREEGWAWFDLAGPSLPGVLARLCTLDLRPGRFAADAIAQTRVAGLDAVLIRRGEGAEILFDITATAAVLRDIAQAARDAGERGMP
jgi:sarcosine oxidase subunit gamma